MKKLKPKIKRYLLRRSEFEVRNNKKRKHKKYTPFNFWKRYDLSYQKIGFEELIAPDNFTLKFEDSNNVLEFIAKLKKLGEQKRKIFISLSNVKTIAEGAISMLLSVMYELSKKGVFLRGDKPKDQVCKDILERSGFFKYMRGHVEQINLNTKNTILRTGNINTPQNIISPEINKAMETVWGSKARCPLLFGGIGEMLRNSCDHAFRNEETINWHLAISHFDDESLVKFSFVDNGEGIISTYNKKGWILTLKDFFKDSAEILDSAFKNGIQSKTGLSWRGKGLPTIYEMYTDNIIKNLVVITNNIYLDFDRGIITTLTTSFSGTYYFWCVDKTCEESYFQ